MSLTSKKPFIEGLLCLVAGAMMALAFAPYHLYFIVYLALPLLFSFWLNGTPKDAFTCGYLFGFGMFGAGVNWLHISINIFGGVNLFGAYIITFLLIAFLSLYPALTGYIARRWFRFSSNTTLIVVIPALWVLSEWCRSWIFTGFPWLNVAYSQIDTPISGMATVAGVYGMSWAVVLSAALLLVMIQSTLRIKIVSAAAILIMWALSWLANTHHWTEQKGGNVSVALIQGAVPQAVKWLPELRQPSLDLYSELSAPHWGKDLIIWPETAIPAYYHRISSFIESLRKDALSHGTDVLVGLPVKNLETQHYYNSAVLLNKTSSFYHKQHLVPFGEYLPLKFLLGDIVSFLDIPMSDFTPGEKKAPLLTGSKIKIGMSICYEGTFGEEIIRALPEADVLVNVSNDAWFGDSAAPHQHLQMARMRALETGRYLLRATNTGISAIIDEKGNITSRSPQFEPATLSSTISLFQGTTPYVVIGNLPVIISLFLFLVLTKYRQKQ